MDADGYPDESELARIESWEWNDIPALMKFIESMWAYAKCGYWQEEDDKWLISTAGWSGNEDIIRALQKNRMVWMLIWEQSRRGGHYIFDKSRLSWVAESATNPIPTIPQTTTNEGMQLNGGK